MTRLSCKLIYKKGKKALSTQPKAYRFINIRPRSKGNPRPLDNRSKLPL